jgi:hypothetical protein
MKTLPTFINVVAFSVLFITHATGASVEKPTGVRRAMVTYSGQLSTCADAGHASIGKTTLNAEIGYDIS